MKTKKTNSTFRSNLRSIVTRQLRTTVSLVGLGLMFSLPLAVANAAEFLSDGNFDNLEVGTARSAMALQPWPYGPGNDLHAGTWAIIETPNPADQREKISIVPTASFDPNLTGNSVRIESPSSASRFYQVFDEPIPESPNEIVRASFDAFVPDTETGRIGGLHFVVGNPGKGPSLTWNSSGQRGSYPLPTESPANTWQHVQMDIDLVDDTYDVFASTGGESLELIAPNVRFTQTQDVLDRVVVWLFPGSEGVAYFDNISVEVLQKTPGDANLDGVVEFQDFLALSEHFGEGSRRDPRGWSQGDFDGNGEVAFPDFLILSENFGAVAAASNSASPVPEPNNVCLTLVGLCGLLGFRKRS